MFTAFCILSFYCGIHQKTERTSGPAASQEDILLCSHPNELAEAFRGLDGEIQIAA